MWPPTVPLKRLLWLRGLEFSGAEEPGLRFGFLEIVIAWTGWRR
jgi:hypothetical protein